jgi:hypothetical protein
MKVPKEMANAIREARAALNMGRRDFVKSVPFLSDSNLSQAEREGGSVKEERMLELLKVLKLKDRFGDVVRKEIDRRGGKARNMNGRHKSGRKKKPLSDAQIVDLIHTSSDTPSYGSNIYVQEGVAPVQGATLRRTRLPLSESVTFDRTLKSFEAVYPILSNLGTNERREAIAGVNRLFDTIEKAQSK